MTPLLQVLDLKKHYALRPGLFGGAKGYVYALRDPRDEKIFYIGKAGGTNTMKIVKVGEHRRP